MVIIAFTPFRGEVSHGQRITAPIEPATSDFELRNNLSHMTTSKESIV